MKNKFFEIAKNEAKKSEYQFRHGAVMIRGGNIITSSFNKARPVNFAHKHHHNNNGSLHAEIGCVLNIEKEKTKGCDIYVVRITKTNDFVISRPCEMCQIICGEMGIKRIYYSIANNEFAYIKL